MKKRIFHIVFSIIIFAVFTGIFSCKSSKKLTDTSKVTEKTESKKEDLKTEENVKKVEKSVTNTTVESKLTDYFDAIATSSSTENANARLSEALLLFASPDVPVFLSFYKENGTKDYDEPTTIQKYLNYIKDQKKNSYKIDNVVYNEKGKIEELELVKR